MSAENEIAEAIHETARVIAEQMEQTVTPQNYPLWCGFYSYRSDSNPRIWTPNVGLVWGWDGRGNPLTTVGDCERQHCVFALTSAETLKMLRSKGVPT